MELFELLAPVLALPDELLLLAEDVPPVLALPAEPVLP